MQADQSLLNDFFKGGKWNQVPHYYNMMKRCFLYRPDLWEVDKIKIIHYTGNPTSPHRWSIAGLQLMNSDTTRHGTHQTLRVCCFARIRQTFGLNRRQAMADARRVEGL